MGSSMRGPILGTTSNSMPRAGRGVRMSLNMMTPSGRKAFQGCRDSSMAMSAVSERWRKPYLSEKLHGVSCQPDSCMALLSGL